MEIIPQLIVNSLIVGGIYALVSVSLALCFCTFRVLNFAHGHLLMLGAYLFYTWHTIYNLSAFLSVILTLFCAVPIALVVLRLFIAPFMAGNPLLGFVSTLALSIMLEALISILFGVNVKSLSHGSFAPPIIFKGFVITYLQLLIVLGAFFTLSALALFLSRTPFGRRLRSLFESHILLQGIGVDTPSMGKVVMCVSTAIAFIGGISIGFETNIQPTMGTHVVIKGFAAMILGGLGSIWGALVGAIVLAFVENFSIGLTFGGYSLPAGYKDAFAFAVILFTLLIRPEGIFLSKKRSV